MASPTRTGDEPARAVSVSQAARMFDLDQTTIRGAINSLDLPAKRVGRKILIRVTDLDAWFDGLDNAREPA